MKSINKMTVTWVSANRFGLELLIHAVEKVGVPIGQIVTISPESNVVMYDGVPPTAWRKLDIPVYETEDINTESDVLKNNAADLLVVCGWRQMIKSEIFNLPRLGTIGFHPSLLPDGRGSAPIINTLLQGKKRSGVTLFHMAEGVDSGDIIGQESFAIRNADHADDVYEKIIEAGKTLVEKYLFRVLDRTAPRTPQEHQKATYFPKPKLSENRIDLQRDSAEQIFCKIKALSKPYRGAYIDKDGQKIILWRAELSR